MKRNEHSMTQILDLSSCLIDFTRFNKQKHYALIIKTYKLIIIFNNLIYWISNLYLALKSWAILFFHYYFKEIKTWNFM